MSNQDDINPSASTSGTEDASIQSMQTDGWSRVSPLAIIYFFAKTLWALGNSLIYTLPVFAFNFNSIKENWSLVLIGVSAALTLILISSLLNYWFYFYKFTQERVEIRQGVFKKSHLDLPFEKIQNVKIVEPLYYRPKQYSFIELDTAGSAQQEAKIVALPIALAHSFKQLILQIKHTKTSAQKVEQDGAAGSVEHETMLNERSIKDLVIHGISNNRVWIVLGFLAPFYNTISENIGTVLAQMGFDIVAYLDYQSQSAGLFLLHVLSLVMLLMLVIVSVSVIGSIFVFYKYRLSRQGDRYIRRSGLLTKHEVSMRLSRIQIAVQQQDWLDVLIKRTNLRFEQNVSGYSTNAQAGNINNASKLIVPSVTPQESIQLIQNAFNVERFSDINFSAISKRYIIRLMIFPIMPLFIGLSALAIANSFSSLGWGVVATIGLISLSLVYLRWRRWGYYFSSHYVYIRKGLLGVNYQVFPINKTQQTAFKQSIFMRRHRLASVRYVLASGAYSVPFIPQDLAVKQADQALYTVAKFKPAWM